MPQEPAASDASPQNGSRLLLILALGAGLIWFGWPMSGYCVGGAVVTSHLALAVVKLQESRAQARGMGSRILSGVLEDSYKAALWFTLGTALVWCLQLLLNMIPSRPSPSGIGEFQLRVYDLVASLRGLASLPHAAVVIGTALLLSLLLGSLSPLALAGGLRKAASALIAILAASASFGFVTVSTGAAAYDVGTAQIRARITLDMDEIREARQQRAALQWISASLSRQALRDRHFGAAWRDYFASGAAQCRAAESLVLQGYTSVFERPPRGAVYCDTHGYLAELASARVRNVAEPTADPPTSWVPDFGALIKPRADSEAADTWPWPQSHEFAIARTLRLADLRGLADSAAATSANAERARRSLRSITVSALAQWFGVEAPEADAILGGWVDAALSVIVKEGSTRVARRLAAFRARYPAAIAELLAIDGANLSMETPTEAADRAGSRETLLARQWRSHHDSAPSDPHLIDVGAERARADLESERQRRIDAERREQERLKEIIKANERRVRERSRGR